jgi:hypothetical protein
MVESESTKAKRRTRRSLPTLTRRRAMMNGGRRRASSGDEIGTTVTAALRRTPAEEKGWTAFVLALRCRQWPQGGPATTGEAAKLGRRSKHGDDSAFMVTETSGEIWRKRTCGRGRAVHCEAEEGDGAVRGRPRRRRDVAGAAAGIGERSRAWRWL